jgi:hypothetical protein
MQYPSGYAHDPSRLPSMQQQSSQQQYAAYAPNLMMQPTPPSNVYESVPHYQPRQSAAIEVLPDRFNDSPYLSSNVQGNMVSPHYMTSQAEQVPFQQQLQQPRPASGHLESQQSGPMSLGVQQYPEETQRTTSAANTLENEKSQYEQHLKLTFQAIRAGKVNEASEKLMQISTWLISSVVALGENHATTSMVDSKSNVPRSSH